MKIKFTRLFVSVCIHTNFIETISKTVLKSFIQYGFIDFKLFYIDSMILQY